MKIKLNNDDTVDLKGITYKELELLEKCFIYIGSMRNNDDVKIIFNKEDMVYIDDFHSFLFKLCYEIYLENDTAEDIKRIENKFKLEKQE
jgi:hypothetical protein